MRRRASTSAPDGRGTFLAGVIRSSVQRTDNSVAAGVERADPAAVAAAGLDDSGRRCVDHRGDPARIVRRRHLGFEGLSLAAGIDRVPGWCGRPARGRGRIAQGEARSRGRAFDQPAHGVQHGARPGGQGSRGGIDDEACSARRSGIGQGYRRRSAWCRNTAFPRCPTGDLLRDAVARQTPLGLEARPRWTRASWSRTRSSWPCSANGFSRPTRRAVHPRRLPAQRGAGGRAVEAPGRNGTATRRGGAGMDVDTQVLFRRLTGRRTCRRCARVFQRLHQPAERARPMRGGQPA